MPNGVPCGLEDAEWVVTKGQPIVNESPLNAASFIAIGEVDCESYTVSVKTKIVNHQPVNGWNEAAGIILRYSSPVHFYFFGFGTFDLNPKGAYCLYMNGSTAVHHFELKPLEWKLNKWYQLKVEARGNRFKYYVDQKLIIDYKDKTFEKGQIGIYAGIHSVVVHYDDFMATGDQVPDLNLSVASNSKLATTWGGLKLQ